MAKRSVRTLALAAGLLATLGVGAAEAQSAREGGYIGLRLLAGMSEGQDLSAAGFGGPLIVTNAEDPTAAAGVVAGYRFGDAPLRLEGEFHQRFRMDLDVRDGARFGYGYENNLSSTAALFTAAWEVRLDGPFTPFLGASVGWVRNTADVERENLRTGAITNSSHSTDNLALGVQGGVGYEVSRNWGLELSYRYLNMGAVETGTLAGGETITADSYVSQDLNLSILYRF